MVSARTSLAVHLPAHSVLPVQVQTVEAPLVQELEAALHKPLTVAGDLVGLVESERENTIHWQADVSNLTAAEQNRRERTRYKVCE